VIEKDGEKIAVYRAPDGGIHVLSAKCTHKGCIVTWNNADLTWDCPCHGSMFAADGSVLHGPARDPLSMSRRDRPAEQIQEERKPDTGGGTAPLPAGKQKQFAANRGTGAFSRF
jgi:nitrite reductase/ring-hydroxylating ferredoxin subunit